MFSSSSLAFSRPTFHSSQPPIVSENASNPKRRVRISHFQNPSWVIPLNPISLSPSPVLQVALPLAASISIILWSNPVNAGILSGSKGLESVPGPQLPQFEFLNRWNDENQKKYAEFDSRFKSTSVLKELLEKSKLNKEKNQKEIQDKYCLRGAEWGVGDCSTQGMTEEERDAFIAMLKKKVGE